MAQRKGSLDTVPPTRDAVYEDEIYDMPPKSQQQQGEKNTKFQKIKQDTIIEQVEEDTKQADLTQEEQDQLKIKEMLQMMDNLELGYKDVKKQFTEDRESAKVEIQIEKELQALEQLQNTLEVTIQSQSESVQNADISQEYQSGKDELLLHVLSQLKVIQTQNEEQQKKLLEKEQEEKRQKDDKIMELELIIQKLKEENQNLQAQSFNNSKFEPQSSEIKDSPHQIIKKYSTEGGALSKDLWLPQNEVASHEFSYFSNTTSTNKLKLKPLVKSTIPHYEYIPPPKKNIIQTSLNKELYKVAQSNRNVFLQAIKVDGTHRNQTPKTKSVEKYNQFSTPKSEPAIGNKYRIKKLQIGQAQQNSQKNIFSNNLSTESLLFSRQQFLNNYNSNKKPSLNNIKDMNDFFFEKPTSQQKTNFY